MVCTKHKVSATTEQHKHLFLRISFVSTDHLRKPEIKYMPKEEDSRIDTKCLFCCSVNISKERASKWTKYSDVCVDRQDFIIAYHICLDTTYGSTWYWYATISRISAIFSASLKLKKYISLENPWRKENSEKYIRSKTCILVHTKSVPTFAHRYYLFILMNCKTFKELVYFYKLQK